MTGESGSDVRKTQGIVSAHAQGSDRLNGLPSIISSRQWDCFCQGKVAGA